jgi:hypothetical protein
MQISTSYVERSHLTSGFDRGRFGYSTDHANTDCARAAEGLPGIQGRSR